MYWTVLIIAGLLEIGWAIGLKYKITLSIFLFTINYYQARFETFFSPRIISDTQLQFQINKFLSFSTQYVLTFDDNPVITNTQIIYSINNSLVIRFQ